MRIGHSILRQQLVQVLQQRCRQHYWHMGDCMYEIIKELKRMFKGTALTIIYEPNKGWDVSYGKHAIFIDETDILGSRDPKREAGKYAEKLRRA